MKSTFHSIVLAVFILVSTAIAKGAIQEKDALRIAKDYVEKSYHKLDIYQKMPVIEYVSDAPAHGGPIWIVGFAYPASQDSNGKIIGVRPFIGLTVWVRPDGSVEGAVSHSP